MSYKVRNKGYSQDNLSKKVESLDTFDELKQLYTSYTNLVVNKNHLLKRMYHKRIVNLQKEKRISNYRIYSDLKLNHGNTNEYLRNEKHEKLSLNNIRRMMDYVVSF